MSTTPLLVLTTTEWDQCLLTFNINEPKGLPLYVHSDGFPTNYTGGDGLLLSARYGGKVILWFDDFYGTRVVGSMNNWKTAEYLGLVLMDDNLSKQGGYTTGSFEPTRSVKAKQKLLMVDMTEQIDELVKAWKGKIL
ncbi:hypothetical protein MKX08_002567 [Trichoderma sp. CBMAI-0020]|nr:hypothetical protein MKX08_002567 [Trichoderma sp. CBMAI-0020]